MNQVSRLWDITAFLGNKPKLTVFLFVDGPYEETPREEEGQADVEKFFDDHLGASERDGMDKENLPSNLAELIIQVPSKIGSHSDSKSRNKDDDFEASSSEVNFSTDEGPIDQDPQQPGKWIDS